MGDRVPRPGGVKIAVAVKPISTNRWVAVQLGFWAAYGTAHFLAILPAIRPSERYAMALASAARAVTGLAVTSALWPALRACFTRGRRLAFALLGAAVALIGLVLWPMVDRSLLTAIASAAHVEIPWIRFPRGLDLEYLIVLLAWAAAAGALFAWSREREAREVLLEQRAATREAQIHALAARLNPHFLFNSLNAIRGLVVEDPERARTTLTRLSDFLRRALDVNPAEAATLAEEVAAAKAYLRIEDARFAPDFEVDVEVDEGVADVLVPALFLQPLVENAVRHGSPNAGGILHVGVRATGAGQRVEVEIVNSGRLGRGAPGIGLELTRSRLRQMYGDAQSVELAEQNGSVVVAVVLTAPRRRAPSEAAPP